jgi:DNA-directed RNA polymerase III subunit RPC1
MLYSLQTLCALLPEVVVCGIPTVARAVISRKSKDSPYELQVEGSDIRQVMATTGVDGKNVVSNDLIAVEKTLGIEAARLTIMKEIQFTMSEHGTHLLSHPFLLDAAAKYECKRTHYIPRPNRGPAPRCAAGRYHDVSRVRIFLPHACM